jgi:hypothetical protein
MFFPPMFGSAFDRLRSLHPPPPTSLSLSLCTPSPSRRSFPPPRMSCTRHFAAVGVDRSMTDKQGRFVSRGTIRSRTRTRMSQRTRGSGAESSASTWSSLDSCTWAFGRYDLSYPTGLPQLLKKSSRAVSLYICRSCCV